MAFTILYSSCKSYCYTYVKAIFTSFIYSKVQLFWKVNNLTFCASHYGEFRSEWATFAGSFAVLVQYLKKGCWSSSIALRSLSWICFICRVLWKVVCTVSKWRFWCTRQGASGPAKKVWRFRTGNFTEWRLVSNSTKSCRLIGSWPLNNCETFKGSRNDPKARTLGAVWIEAKRRRTPVLHVRAIASTTEKKGISSSYRYWWWEMDSLRQSKT